MGGLLKYQSQRTPCRIPYTPSKCLRQVSCGLQPKMAWVIMTGSGTISHGTCARMVFQQTVCAVLILMKKVEYGSPHQEEWITMTEVHSRITVLKTDLTLGGSGRCAICRNVKRRLSVMTEA